MKNINTLVQDVYQTVSSGDWFSNSDYASAFSTNLARRLQDVALSKKQSLLLSDDQQTNVEQGLSLSTAPALRMSKLGPWCPRALWHSVHTPHLAVPLQGWSQMIFLYGFLVEELMIGLIKNAGHTVTGEQDELYLDGVVGHRDAVIDGCVLDVKSCNNFTFEKFKTGRIADDDMFGYLDQLDGYIAASNSDPLVNVKDRGYILAVDKQKGHMVLYEHKLREERIRNRIRDYTSIIKLPSPPGCTCGTRPFGSSGNIALDTRASYSQYKYCCFPELRTFIYKDGPVFLTKVVREPEVLEVDKHGNHVRSS